jgi:predicted amidohydrolase YtcJ
MTINTIDYFSNAKILSMDLKNSVYKAMAIIDEKILFLGSNSEVDSKINEFIAEMERNQDNSEDIRIRKHDISGSCIVPGFIDAHLHPILSIYFLTQMNLSQITSISQLKESIQEKVKELDEEDWIFGVDLMEDNFIDPNEQIFPTKQTLDECCSTRPVVILRHDGHICGVNSLTLEKLEITGESIKELDIKGGEIRIDETGDPNGIFTEAATTLIISKIPLNFNRLKQSTLQFCNQLTEAGITSCGGIIQLGNEGPSGDMGALEASFMQTLISDGLIEQDYVFCVITNKAKKLKRLQKTFSKLKTEKDRYTIGGVKLYADGTFGASTAYMYEPFADATDGNLGFMVHEIDELKSIAQPIIDLQMGFDIECHVIGDKANELVVQMFKELQTKMNISENQNSGTRFHLEHASILTKKTIEIASKNKQVFICQPNFIESEESWLEKRLGSERIIMTYPFRTIIDMGGIIAGSSDAPIESVSVLKGLQNCVTRRGFVPEQAITPLEALKMYTYNAAYAIGQENIKGSIEIEKLADFVILDKNPLAIASENIENIKILATYHRGKKIYTNKI